jgi:hypothetical protein
MRLRRGSIQRDHALAGLVVGGDAIGLLQALVDQGVELRELQVVDIALAGQFEQPGHGLVLGVGVDHGHGVSPWLRCGCQGPRRFRARSKRDRHRIAG